MAEYLSRAASGVAVVVRLLTGMGAGVGSGVVGGGLGYGWSTCWLALSLVSCGGGVLAIAGRGCGSCWWGPNVTFGGAGFGADGSSDAKYSRHVAALVGAVCGFAVAVLMPCCSGDLLRRTGCGSSGV